MNQIDVEVDRLELDCGNPRHRSVGSQQAALDALILDQRQKLMNLALDIHANGLSPAHRLVVIEAPDGRYTVLDGNRRLAALRILKNPSLLPSEMRPANFAETAAGPGNQPEQVACSVMADRDSAGRWLERAHTGQMEGVGVIPWSPAAQHRFRPLGRRTHTAAAVAALDWLRPRTAADTDLQDKISTVEDTAITNLGRLLTDPDVRDLIAIGFDGDQLVALDSEAAVVRRLSEIVKDLAGETGVGTLMHKPDRAAYIRGLLGSDVHSADSQLNPDGSSASSAQLDAAQAGTSAPLGGAGERDDAGTVSSEPLSGEETTSRRRVRVSTEPRRMFADLRANGFNTRAQRIFEELKQLNLDRFANAAAVLLRSAIEFSVTGYLTEKGTQPVGAMKFRDRVTRTIEHLEQNSPERQRERRYDQIKTDLQNPHSPAGATNLHSYVHSPNNAPTASELEAISVKYTVLIQDISDALEQHGEG